MDTLKDKVVLITGAGKGSGRLLAQTFAYQAALELSPHGIQVYAVRNFKEPIVETMFALLDLKAEEQ